MDSDVVVAVTVDVVVVVVGVVLVVVEVVVVVVRLLLSGSWCTSCRLCCC